MARKENGPPCNRNRGPLPLSKMCLIAAVPLTALLLGALDYICNSKTIKGVSVSVFWVEIN